MREFNERMQEDDATDPSTQEQLFQLLRSMEAAGRTPFDLSEAYVRLGNAGSVDAQVYLGKTAGRTDIRHRPENRAYIRSWWANQIPPAEDYAKVQESLRWLDMASAQGHSYAVTLAADLRRYYRVTEVFALFDERVRAYKGELRSHLTELHELLSSTDGTVCGRQCCRGEVEARHKLLAAAGSEESRLLIGVCDALTWPR
jgi:hypothetical protein